ncbi:TBC1 domain family member 19 isoform X1 [Lampetra planeri]
MLEMDVEATALLTAQIVCKLADSNFYSRLHGAVTKEVQSDEVRLSTLSEDLRNALKKSGWKAKLQNAVYREMSVLPSAALSPELRKEPLAYMRRAQAQWEKRVMKSLNSMCTELGVTLYQKRSPEEQKGLLSKWSEMGSDEPDLSRFRPVYAPKDFLEVLVHLQDPEVLNFDPGHPCRPWGLVQVPLGISTSEQLSQHFKELALHEQQTGLEDVTPLTSESFEVQREKLAKKVLETDESLLAQHFARKGCPNAQRAALWLLILNVSMGAEEIQKYEQLKSAVVQQDLLVDNLIYKDVKLTASNDDYYFVFEDFLYQVLLCFSRDTKVLSHFEHNSATPPKTYSPGKMGVEEFATVYPPSGVIPFHGFTMYVAPLCFLYHEPHTLYYAFRQMYVRHFFRLHSVSSHPSGIVALCLLFETTLQRLQPRLFHHLRDIGAQPLRIAFKWLVRAFSGYLATDQLLLLWDRLLGFNSLELLAVLAVAIFVLRAENLMEAASLASAEAVLADLSTVKVVPLLQLVLFGGLK